MTGPLRQDALRAAVARLQAAGIEGAARDARLLLAHAEGVAPDRLTLHMGEPMARGAVFEALVAARLARQPVSQIIGRRMFWGRWFTVTPEVLDPRPETEILIEAALAAPFERVIDLGTGSGAILITLLAERGVATGLGVDLSPAALDVARANAQALGVKAEWVVSDWCQDVSGRFDLIVSNPPYIGAEEMPHLAPETQWEPKLALTPGGDGLDAYRAIVVQVPRIAQPGARLLMEIGPSQGAAVVALARAAGWSVQGTLCDLDGRDRVVGAIWPG